MICSKCNKKFPDELKIKNRRRCPECYKLLRKLKDRKYYISNQKKFIKYRKEHIVERNKWLSNYHKAHRKLVLQYYSNHKIKCKYCGETDEKVLTIDHINGGGQKHLREQKLGHGGSRLYDWLIKNNYPVGYQVLCMNCQKIKMLDNDETYNKHNTDLFIRRKRQQYTRKVKITIFTHYGQKCVICGQTNIKCLELDHINNDGAEHRRLNGYAGITLYWWLQRNNYPILKDVGLQVLCANCNHKKEKERRQNSS